MYGIYKASCGLLRFSFPGDISTICLNPPGLASPRPGSLREPGWQQHGSFLNYRNPQHFMGKIHGFL